MLDAGPIGLFVCDFALAHKCIRKEFGIDLTIVCLFSLSLMFFLSYLFPFLSPLLNTVVDLFLALSMFDAQTFRAEQHPDDRQRRVPSSENLAISVSCQLSLSSRFDEDVEHSLSSNCHTPMSFLIRLKGTCRKTPSAGSSRMPSEDLATSRDSSLTTTRSTTHPSARSTVYLIYSGCE